MTADPGLLQKLSPHLGKGTWSSLEDPEREERRNCPCQVGGRARRGDVIVRIYLDSNGPPKPPGGVKGAR